MTTTTSACRPQRHRHLVWRRLGTASAIYGSLVYSALIAAASAHDDHETDIDEILAFSAITLVAFWIAHIFAGTFAHFGNENRTDVSLFDSARDSLAEAIGMLEAAVLPSAILLLGVLGLLDPDRAVTLALQSSLLMLALLGFIAMSVRRARWWWRVVVALVAASLGGAIIVIEAALH